MAGLLGDVPLDGAATTGGARKRLARSDPSVLLTARSPDQATAALLADVRAGRFGSPDLPVVAAVDGDDALASDLGVDLTVPVPLEGPALRDAVERARVLGKYRDAIGEFFEISRQKSRGSATAERLAVARREADRWLSAIETADELPVEVLLGTG